MDKKEALNRIVGESYEFKKLPDKFKKDRMFILEAVKKNCEVLEFVDDIFKKDKEIVLEALKKKVMKINMKVMMF